MSKRPFDGLYASSWLQYEYLSPSGHTLSMGMAISINLTVTIWIQRHEYNQIEWNLVLEISSDRNIR